jgi:hypothetical protein
MLISLSPYIYVAAAYQEKREIIHIQGFLFCSSMIYINGISKKGGWGVLKHHFSFRGFGVRANGFLLRMMKLT